MKKFLSLIFLAVLLTSCDNDDSPNEEIVFKISFGSCAKENKPQPMLDIARGLNPDAFIYLGDNIYGDTYSMDTLRMKYNMLAKKPEFQNLLKSTTVYSVWDDHDYGANDAGRYYPLKRASEELFLDFWKVPENSERRQHEGIYGTEWLEKGDKKVQLILLDTRYFRDNLVRRKQRDSIYKNDYVPNLNPDSTFLGKTQWKWLEQQLKMPADLRIIASSNQFSHEYNGWESWNNVPFEQQKMIDLIAETKAERVIFISGDVHWGEINKRPTEKTYPIYDVTSSGITETWDVVEPSKYRVGEAVAQNNVGLIEVVFAKNNKPSLVSLALVDSTAQRVRQQVISLSEIEFESN